MSLDDDISQDELFQERLNLCRSLVQGWLLQIENMQLKEQAQLLRDQTQLLRNLRIALSSEPQDSQVMANLMQENSQTKQSEKAASSGHQDAEFLDIMEEESFNLEVFKQILFDAGSRSEQSGSSELSKVCAALMQQILANEKKKSEKSGSSQPASCDH